MSIVYKCFVFSTIDLNKQFECEVRKLAVQVLFLLFSVKIDLLDKDCFPVH